MSEGVPRENYERATERLVDLTTHNTAQLDSFMTLAREQGWSDQEILRRAQDVSPRTVRAVRAALAAGR